MIVLVLASAAQAAVVTVSCSPSNVPANPILNSSAANLASGAFVQVIDNTSGSVSAPNPSTGAPSSGGSVISTGTLSAAGTFTKSGVSIPTGHYVYIVAWETWNGSGTPTGNYGISTISAAMSGISYTYKPASFSTGTPIAPVSLSSATPNSGMQGATLPTVAIVGTNTHFTASSVISFGANITVGSVTYTDATHVTANNVVIAAGAAAGFRSVSVTTGGETATGNIFTVTAAPVPVLSATPATLTFNAQVNTSNPANQNVSITNTGSGTLTWSATKTQSWLTINPASGTAPSTITVSANIAGLSVGQYTDTISITSNGGNSSVAVTLNVTALPPATLTSATPNSGQQGQTLTTVAIVGTNTHFTASSIVSFGGADISVSSITFVSATQITANTVAISASATTGPRNVSVTTGSETATGQIFTVTTSGTSTATSITIDDYEGAAGNSSNQVSSYYVFAPGVAYNPTANRITTDKHSGTYAMNTVYPATTEAWRGFGGTLVKTLDLSGYSDVAFWVKGDGSANKLKFQVKDADGTNFAVSDADAIPLSSTSWTEYRITGFQTKMTRVTGTTSGDANLDWTKVTEYQFVFSGTAASSTGVLIDDVIATNATSGNTPHIVSITPSTGSEKITVTITGSNFLPSGVTGGSVNFMGGGAMTSVKSSDTNSLITSWSDTTITMSLPGMGAGTKTVNIVRSDSVASDNSVTFEVTASATAGAGVTYNYPNPFNPLRGDVTNIIFSPGSAQSGSIRIYDMTARQIDRIDWTNTAGTMTVQWDGKNNYNEIVGDGVYLYRIVDAGSGKLINKGKILVINK